MKTPAACFLLLFAASATNLPHLLAQTNQPAQPSETTDRGAAKQPSRARTGNQTFPTIPSSMALGQDVKFEGYEVRTYRAGEHGDPSQAFEVLKGGRRVYSRVDDDGMKYSVGCLNKNDPGNRDIRPGKDITGEGKPNLVIADWTGGAHCCLTYYIFELDDQVREVGRIDARHGEGCRFRKEREGKVDFLINDWTFAYWNAPFAFSPAPQVILRYQAGSYHVAADLMVKPAPSPGEFQQLVEKGRRIPRSGDGSPASKFWGIMLDLIYSGHANLAWKFCDGAWPSSAESKQEFLRSSKSQLSTSPYWEAIKAMNGL
jgi:hypothetical protein